MTDSASSPQDWQERRRQAALDQAARAARIRADETARAQELIARFVAEARRRGLTTRALIARSRGRFGRYRTGLTGWYLMRDGSIGVSQDGGYYNLSCPPSLRGRLRGVTLDPGDPPVQVGAGARDGESVALDVLLAMRLDAGDDWGTVE